MKETEKKTQQQLEFNVRVTMLLSMPNGALVHAKRMILLGTSFANTSR